MALQADLLGAHALGVRRIVCETGSPPLLGDYPHVDGIWDVDSIGLIELLASLNAGPTTTGCGWRPRPTSRSAPGSTRAAGTPEREAGRGARKIAAGAQLPDHPPGLRAGRPASGCSRRLGGPVPVLAAVRPLTSFAEAEYLAHEVPDVIDPGRHADRAAGAGGSAARPAWTWPPS